MPFPPALAKTPTAALLLLPSLHGASSLFVAFVCFAMATTQVRPIVASQWDRAGEGNGLEEKRKLIVWAAFVRLPYWDTYEPHLEEGRGGEGGTGGVESFKLKSWV